MATRYKLYADVDGQAAKCIQKILDDGTLSCVPMIPDNTDYAEYLEWAKTNTIEAAD
tara:strand:- start:102 stop:272 length:171 start_codon:yes stop_codon:yes gene_type:complete